MPPKKKKKEEDAWEHSEGKKLLEQDLRSGAIPLDPKQMPPRVAFDLRPEFAFPNLEDGKRLFASRLAAARKKIKHKNESAALQSAALKADRQIHPKPTHNHRGEPRWEGSAAEGHLKVDIAANKQNEMAPKELHKLRPEYSAYPLEVFRGHIYQEERLVKFKNQRQNRHQCQ